MKITNTEPECLSTIHNKGQQKPMRDITLCPVSTIWEKKKKKREK